MTDTQMKKLLLIYASYDGHSGKISRHVSQHLQSLAQVQVDVAELKDGSEEFRLENYDSVFICAPIRYGFHLSPAAVFAKRQHQRLNTMHSIFCSVCLTARKGEKGKKTSQKYITKFLDKANWRATSALSVAGALYYSKYTWYDKMMIRFIMWLTKGDTDTSQDYCYTDWKQLESFAQSWQDTVLEKPLQSALIK